MTEDKQKTRERLVYEMARLVQTKGFNSTSINDVIQAVGIKKGTLYYYFSGKEELGLAVLEKDRDDFLSFLETNLSGKNPQKALEQFFKAAFKKHKDTGFVGGCLWGNTALEMSDTNPVYKKVVEKVFSEWIVRIEAVIRSGQQTGQIRADRSAGELAYLVVASIEGGIMISRITKKDGPFKSCLNSIRTLLRSENIHKKPDNHIR
ncbi:MAG: TetR/AcrR family transcriptional regulator [Phycisphaerae bacterium]|nr:TetR/AcrR family transcriptional regulator [Phycisphaerae bacterium]